ncbi:hypothetical protein LPJ78_000107 [Coemansia sp. RSA 989]|nr:hypothetical protein LPJ78_000107 [Coemansia sp. RSA 989]
MQHYHSNDDNYLQLSQNSAASGGSGASTAGPQPYRNSYPLHEPLAAGAVKAQPAIGTATHTVGGPLPYTKQKHSQRPFVVYPEVRPPPISQALTAPPTAFGPVHPPAALPPSGNTFWGQVPEIAPKTYQTSPYPALQQQQQQQQYIPPPPPPPPVPNTANAFAPTTRPGYYKIPKHGKQLRPSSHSRPPVVPGAFYPQSAPISPTHAYDPCINVPEPRAHTYQQMDVFGMPGQNAQPLSAPALQPPAGCAAAQPMPLYAVAMGPQASSSSRPSSGRQTPKRPHMWAKSPPNSSKCAYDFSASRLQIAYLRNKNRVCQRSNFNTLFHCLKPVDLVSKSSVHMANNRERHRGNLYPLYKVNEDWIAPNVGLPLENKPGYRFMLYIVDGTLLYDNGISGEKLLSKGTIHMFTTSRDISIYARNPSKTHRAHIIRMWIETDELLKNNSSCTTASDTVVPTRSHEHRKEKSPSAVAHPDFHGLIRHVADSDKLNCLLIMAQPDDYLPSFGMTDLIYGPMAKPAVRAKDSLADIRSSAASPLESSYYMSQSAILTRPEYFTPEPADLESNEEDEEKWEVTDPQLTSRVCVDPLKVEEDIFISICQLEVGDKVIYEPYDLHDRERALKRQSANPSRGGHRRVWIQTIMADLNNDASANGGRLVINGDMNNRMRPGDSAYVRRLELHETLFIENCGRVPIDFIVVETPY